MLMPEKNPETRVTVEDLLRLKRAERPPEAFWAQFEQDLRTRQLAAGVQQRRWWFGLSQSFAGFSRFQMPVGAAAVLAVTFLSVREYREPGLELAVSPQVQVTVNEAAINDDSAAVAAVIVDASPPADSAPAMVAATTPVQTRTAVSREVTSLVPWSAQVSTDAEPDILTPSARSIAANLAAATESQPEWGNLLVHRVSSFAANSAGRAEPLAQVVSPTELRRERLFAYHDAEPEAEVATLTEGRITSGREHLVNRLSDERLYETVRRMNAGGDRLTLRF